VTKTYADVSTPDGRARLGDKAAGELTRIRNVPNLKVGKTAPDIAGKDLDGKPFKLSDYRGKVVVLDFWGHW
jgi:cytochrome oxidase Cu insertion factor (SCO1/SenC/PrrC family)